MRYTRQIEFPDCETAAEAKDALLDMMCVKVLPDGYGRFAIQVDEDGYFTRCDGFIEAISRAKFIKGVVREAGTERVCYQRPILIVTVPGTHEVHLRPLLRRTKLKPLK